MTTIIKIDRASIKKNPKAGNTRTKVIGMATTSFNSVCTQEDLDKLSLEKDVIIITIGYPQNGLIDISGIIEHPDFDITKLPGKWQVNSNKNIETVHHLPELKWFYKYVPKKVKCSECKKLISDNKIISEWHDDGIPYDLCPNCSSINTFDIKYEDINLVVKEMYLE